MASDRKTTVDMGQVRQDAVPIRDEQWDWLCDRLGISHTELDEYARLLGREILAHHYEMATETPLIADLTRGEPPEET